MEENKAQTLQLKLRDKLNNVSYSTNSSKPQELIVFLDSQYKEALESGAKQFTTTSIEVSKEKTYFALYIGLNGDKTYLKFVENKGLENFDIFVKWNQD